jgi:hypothetical protein
VSVLAESSTSTGQAGLSASASVNFKIVIPPVLALNVAAGASAQPSDGREPLSSVLRGTRSITALPDQPAVTLRSNMRQLTVIQDLRGQAVYTVLAP